MSFFGLFRRVQPVSKRNAAIAAAVALVIPVTAAFEGLRTKPYRDPTNTLTVCYGETHLPMRVYSADECGAMLRKRLAKDYAPQLLDCVPALINRPNPYAALLDFSYNAGVQAACRSRMARNFNLGRWPEGCAAFRGTYVTSKGVKLKGLVRRREAEAALCLKS
jgi:lysozyme